VYSDRDVREQTSAVAVRAGLLQMRSHNNLEDAFLRLTGEAKP